MNIVVRRLTQMNINQMRINMNTKLESGTKVPMYVLQPIPRKDRKETKFGKLVIYGWKKTMGLVMQENNDKVWLKPDDRPYSMTLKRKHCGFDVPSDSDGYIYVQDLEKGHPLYLEAGLRDPEEVREK